MTDAQGTAGLAGDGAERGAVFTRPEVAEAMLDLVGYTSDQPLHQRRLLEPSFGAGAFLLPAVDRLLAACRRACVSPRQPDLLRGAIRGVEIDKATYEQTREAVCARLLAWGMARRGAAALCDAWLVLGDFLLQPLDRLADRFDVVVGNPPYVRQERIAPALLVEYRWHYRTIYGRADLYIPFFERGLKLLRDGGQLAYVCSNRWLKNRYGGPLRDLIARDFHLSHVIGLESAEAFTADVLAYPAITAIRAAQPGRTQVARASIAELPAVVRAMTGGPAHTRVDVIERAVGEGPWLLDTGVDAELVRRLARDFPTLAEAGCEVGIGVTTGADKVFVGDFVALPVEDARKLPLVMAPDLREGALEWRGKGVVNPFEPDGQLAALDRYPRFARFCYQHAEALHARHVARRNPSSWYRTIDRIDARLASTPKLLLPDIQAAPGSAPTVVYDEGKFYPHHNLYYVTSSSWDLRALATVLRSSIARMLLEAYSVRMSGGYLRFQAQYLRRIRLPLWADVPPATRAALIGAAPADRAAIDRAAAATFGLTSGEAAILPEATP